MVITFAQAQIVNIPNSSFKYNLVNLNCVDVDNDGVADFDADTNNDGEIQVSEAEAVVHLRLTSGNITSLIGIDAFSNLETLYIRSNTNLTSLDVTTLSNLTSLTSFQNGLTSINVNGLTNLTYLQVGFSQLTAIDLGGLTNLNELILNNNLLTTLDISSLTNLEILQCSTNQLTELDASGLLNLENLDVGANPLNTLNLSGLINLETLYCFSNSLTTLDASNLSSLSYLNCNFNPMTLLDINGSFNLIELQCRDTQLETINLDGLYNLREIYGDGSQFTELDVSMLPNLQALDLKNNQLETLNLSASSNITFLQLQNNQLKSMFLKNGSEFTGSTLSFNFINNPNLEYICVDDFELDSILAKVDNYGYTNCVVNSYCSFAPGGEFYTIQGESKLDTDSDGCNINDPIFPNLKFNMTDGNSTVTIISNATGDYSIPVQTGSQTITPILENPTYFTATPTSVIVNFPSDSSPYNQDFCVLPNGIHNDLEIIILALEQARPGFDTDYKIIYKNKGNTELSGTVNLTFQDEVMDLISANPVADTQIVNELSWNFSNLLPFESREIKFTMNLNAPTEAPPLNVDDVLIFTATANPVSGDETPDDNEFILNQPVVNSFDPNDKTCLQGETITPEQVGEFVHYMIRFENTGTASAINVVVKDEIDTNKYDVSSLIPLNSSYEFVTRIKDDNVVEFIFENINLPFDDATNDGYVLFKIKTLESLTLGDTFSNDAEIYFDYNAAIITNDELTTVAENLSIQETELQSTVEIYPNPTSDFVHLKSVNPIESVVVYDIHGRQIQAFYVTGSSNNTKINLVNHANGVYFLKIKTTIGVQTSKIIKQ
ncbi:conserved repeat domain-containing protein/Por secretion system C-terminal sorting domain-containing protein [Bizionia echini]|uniref:Conserved repeat domain-containing protein/Por secretion system C-terminal sorting domain-containing protein n=2 Tax=Bizionia echini TaxID=649333 RepID=A0A1I5D753_9FLAO|nr:conserved repeat domain-containing protein/Por secretion system C-terminal sorting domain-containing protein [Bizionia echini]